MPTVTYYELSQYNNGNLIPKTFDLEGTTHEDHMEEVQEWLEDLTEATGELCEEWIIAWTSGVPESYVSQYDIDPEFWEYLAVVAEFGEGIVQAAVELDIPLDTIDDCFAGCYDSWEDWAWDFIDDCGYLADVPEMVAQYFDYARYANDARLSGEIVEHEGYFFYNH